MSNRLPSATVGPAMLSIHLLRKSCGLVLSMLLLAVFVGGAANPCSVANAWAVADRNASLRGPAHDGPAAAHEHSRTSHENHSSHENPSSHKHCGEADGAPGEIQETSNEDPKKKSSNTCHCIEVPGYGSAGMQLDFITPTSNPIGLACWRIDEDPETPGELPNPPLLPIDHVPEFA
ncbi:MAG: hypothetical protein GY725_18215 [bacterium]|nr:hypothetical protein [bacterium]